MIRASVFAGIVAVTALALGSAVGCSPAAREETDAVSSEAASSTNLTISQVYSAGGTKGAAYARDFVEIFNRGLWPVSLDGISLQVTEANANFEAEKRIALPSKTLGRGSYLLIELGGAGGGPRDGQTPLPTPDLQADAALGVTAGRVALARTPLSGCGSIDSPCRPSAALSLVSYGGPDAGAGLAELGPTLAAKGKGDVCVDTGSDERVFEIEAPTPRNSATPLAS
jgi:hypothetical protein